MADVAWLHRHFCGAEEAFSLQASLSLPHNAPFQGTWKNADEGR